MQFGPEIRQIASAVRIKRILAEAKRLASTTASTVVFAGWVPSSSRNVIFQEAKKVDKLSYISGRKPEETAVKAEDIPVRLSHNPLLKPFQILTETYGIPAYGTIDPTVFVAITFLAMFGAMFGDVGDGLALCIPAIFLLKRRVEFLRKTAALLLYAGLSSIVFGFLYGSFFGVEFRALWLKPMEDAEHLFRAFIIFGMAVLTFGVALNVINALRHRRWRDAFLDKAGLFSGVAYWAGIGIAVRFLSQKPLSPALIAVFAVTLFAIFIVPVVEAAIRKKGALIAATEHGIDIFEILLGYLANTVSFIRIAAFALNHAGFFFVIFQISGMLKNSAGGVLSAMTLIFGNILIILLEGMVVMIQSLRLNYYEFFSRFVTTGKIKYQPLGIKTAGQMK
jgi:V/A-type H+-transporting ATPase subunit I